MAGTAERVSITDTITFFVENFQSSHYSIGFRNGKTLPSPSGGQSQSFQLVETQ